MMCQGPNMAGDGVRCPTGSPLPPWIRDRIRKATKGTELQTA